MVDQTGEDAAAKFGRSLRFLRQQSPQLLPIQVRTHQVEIDLGPWAPMPDWARFFVELGSALAIHPDASLRIVSAVSTPTRAYAAALCACGVTLARSSIPITAGAAEHLEVLRSLPPNTTLTCVGEKRKWTAWLIECVTENGKEIVRIQEPNGVVTSIPAERCLKIQLSRRQLEELPERRMTRRIRAELGLLGAMMQPGAAAEFVRRSRLECAIVGSEAKLREEIHDVLFAVVGTDKKRHNVLVEGYFQDVLRTRSLIIDGEGYRSDVFPASRIASRRAREETPLVVIFDGANGFLKWSDVWPDANWVVILDRTDHRFADAANEINRLYSTTRVQGASLPEVPEPRGIESMMFEVSRR